MHRMSDTIIGFLALFGSAIFAWHLIAGLKSGDMDSPNMLFAKGNRVHSPVRFWLLTGHNSIFLLGSIFILGNALGLYRL
jgi:hypothetical protein